MTKEVKEQTLEIDDDVIEAVLIKLLQRLPLNSKSRSHQ